MKVEVVAGLENLFSFFGFGQLRPDAHPICWAQINQATRGKRCVDLFGQNRTSNPPTGQNLVEVLRVGIQPFSHLHALFRCINRKSHVGDRSVSLAGKQAFRYVYPFFFD